jgi:hypothetical protein
MVGPGRLELPAAPLRRRLLCPAELRATGGRSRSRTGVLRFAGGFLVSRACDLGASPAGLEPATSWFGTTRSIHWATETRVGESGIEPPRQRLRLYRPLSSPPCSTHRGGTLRDSNPPLSFDTGSQPVPSATWVKAPVDQAGVEPARRGVWDRCSAAELLIG